MHLHQHSLLLTKDGWGSIPSNNPQQDLEYVGRGILQQVANGYSSCLLNLFEISWQLSRHHLPNSLQLLVLFNCNSPIFLQAIAPIIHHCTTLMDVKVFTQTASLKTSTWFPRMKVSTSPSRSIITLVDVKVFSPTTSLKTSAWFPQMKISTSSSRSIITLSMIVETVKCL